MTTSPKKQAILKAYKEAFDTLGRYPTYQDLRNLGISKDRVRHHFSSLNGLKLAFSELVNNDQDTLIIEPEDITTLLIKAYIQLVSTHGRYPGFADFRELGHTERRIRHHVQSLTQLKRLAQSWADENNLDVFDKIIDLKIFTDENYTALRERLKGFKRYVISTAVVNGTVHQGFLENIKAYCAHHNAALLILPAADPASAGNWCLDPLLDRESIVVGDIALNSNLFVCSIKLNAKQIDPSTGLGRIGQRNGSFVYASPKQRLKFHPVSNVKFPHAEMTTGAITLPRYFDIDRSPHSRYYSERTAYIANHDHVMGAIIVEISDNSKYHFRQIQADENGAFVDLGNFYNGGQVSRLDAEAISLGDWHSGETDPTAIKATKELIEVVRPSKLFLHDVFNGLSINPHELDKRNRRHYLAASGKLSLENELRTLAADLNMLLTWSPIQELIIVKSNHDIFLNRWLEYGRFVDDVVNYGIGLDLAKAMKDGHDPLKFGVETIGLSSAAKVRWLQIDEDYFISRIQCGAHGHKGPKGSRGNIAGMERSYGRSVTGHSHTPEILRGAWQNGTMSYLKLDYNEGPSDWVHASTVIYPNGMRQLINSFDGEWRMVD